MKTIVSLILLTFLASVILLPLAEQRATAQAPTGPQGSAPPPPSAAPQAPAAPQQAPQGGVSIAVEVPIVTLEVVATTQHGDILTGLKKENFRLTDEGVPQTITNFGPTDAPINDGAAAGIQQPRLGRTFSLREGKVLVPILVSAAQTTGLGCTVNL